MLETVMAYGQIIIADLILSGDNALIIGMAAAGLAPELRKRAIFYGMVIAAVLRIIFAVIATTLLGIPGILFIGSLLLFWVCWRLFQEIRSANNNQPHSDTLCPTPTLQPQKKPWPRLSYQLQSQTSRCLWIMCWQLLRSPMAIVKC